MRYETTIQDRPVHLTPPPPTGWPPGLLQDDSRGLSRWFASKPDARRRVREACADTARARQEQEGDRPDSPCIGRCTTLYDEFCRGCGRHYLEVARWGQMTDGEKEEIWRRLERQMPRACGAGDAHT